MKVTGFVITAAVVAGFSVPAFAQQGSGAGSTQSAGSTQNVATNQQPVTQVVTNTLSDDTPRNWMASGFIGTNFGASRSSSVNLFGIEDLDSNNSTSANFGGQIAYVGRGVIGGEFLADFSPGMGTVNNLLFTEAPDVNSYMFNLIAVAPFGRAHSYDPYISGGIGWVKMNSTIFTLDPTLAPNGNIDLIGTESVSGSRFGWDLGGGVMAFSEKNWGFRADVRYYATTSDTTDVFDLNNIGDGTIFSRVALSGLSFWKANAGIAFRW